MVADRPAAATNLDFSALLEKSGVTGVTGVTPRSDARQNSELTGNEPVTPGRVTPGNRGNTVGAVTPVTPCYPSGGNSQTPAKVTTKQLDTESVTPVTPVTPEKNEGEAETAACVTVTCSACRHFQPNPSGDPNAIGSCASGEDQRRYGLFLAALDAWERRRRPGDGPMPEPSLRPGVERVCDAFKAADRG